MVSLTQGSAFADGIRIGNVRGGQTYINTGTPEEPVWVPASYPTFDNGAPGIPKGVDYPFVIIPSANEVSNLVADTTLINAGAIPLTAGAGVTLDTTTFPGYNAYDLGVARTLLITPNGTTADITFTISGWDMYKAPVVENCVVESGDASQTTKKAMRWIHSIQASTGSGAGTIEIGTSNIFGLPYRLLDASYILSIWNGAWDYIWYPDPGSLDTEAIILLGDSTFPATATTGDVRGTYQFETVNGDGNTVLALRILNPYMDPYYLIKNGLTEEPKMVYGVAQYSTGWL